MRVARRYVNGIHHPVVAYFLLTYAISWLTLGLVSLDSHDLFSLHVYPGLLPFLTLIGSSGPFLAALFLVATDREKGSVRGFFRQLLIWRVHLYWYLVVLFEPALVTLIALFTLSVVRGASFDLSTPPVVEKLGFSSSANPWLLLIPVFLLGGLVGGPLGEEPGWRGYALPKLQAGSNPLFASLIVGVIWGVWHLPFFFIEGTSQSNTPFLLFVLGVVASSILFTWVFNRTRGSVLLALLFHAALNTTSLYLPLSLLEDLPGVVAQSVVALVVVIAVPRRWFWRPSPVPSPR